MVISYQGMEIWKFLTGIASIDVKGTNEAILTMILEGISMPIAEIP